LFGVWLRIPRWRKNVVIKTEQATAGQTILFKCRRLVEASEESTKDCGANNDDDDKEYTQPQTRRTHLNNHYCENVKTCSSSITTVCFKAIKMKSIQGEGVQDIKNKHD
jgi:hypothetical protein